METKILTYSLVALVLSSAPHAWADPDTAAKLKLEIGAAASKLAEQELATVMGAAKRAQVSPEFTAVGVGLSAGVGATPGQGANQSVGGTLQLRLFGEGSTGGTTTSLENLLPYNERYRVLEALEAQFLKKIEDAPLTDLERLDLRGNLAEKTDEQLRGYTDAYERLSNHAIPGMQPTGRPLYVVEGGAQYNMVGHSSGAGTYTGFKGNIKTGVGFSLKDYGKNGCDIYFLVHAEAAAEANYKLENADKASGAVGLEQGPLCQIANAVTVMASPSVQVGGFSHSNPYGGDTLKSDWLNYAARFRLIVNNKLYTSFEVLRQPSMSNDKTAAHWSSTEFNGTIDAKLVDTWTVGADWRAQQYSDENAANTGNRPFSDTYVGAHVIRVF